MGRILIFTGKGGVGKTSAAAAHAGMSAKEGAKTLLVSTDMAHNLSDLFEQPIGRECVTVSDNLDAMEIDPDYMMMNDYKEMTQAVTNMLTSVGGDKAGTEDMVMLPGMNELFSLLKILDIYESGKYERIIIDCAPTGETLSLLKFPELLCWYMEKFFPIGKVAVRVLAPVSKKLFKVQLPNKEAMSDIEKIYYRLIRLQELLKDREVSSVRLVTIPEKMVLEETKRNYMYLNLYNFYVDGVYINRILPKEIGNSFFDEWQEIQNAYIKELEDIFRGIPIRRIPWYESDLCGMDSIDRMCDDVLAGERIFDIIKHQAGEQYEQTDSGYTLRLYCPCLSKEDLNLYQSGTDVILKVGNFKRNISLPNVLRDYEITAAGIRDDKLYVDFQKGVGEDET